MKFYAGIGSRKTPIFLLPYINIITKILYRKNYILRSGGAVGADKMFENSLFQYTKNHKEIFYSDDAEPWCFVEVLKHFPNDRNKKSFGKWKPYIKGLLARNMMQILGKTGKDPVDFVICWCPSKTYENSQSGGTGYALRCAEYYNISIFNFFNYKNPKKMIYEIINKIKE